MGEAPAHLCQEAAEVEVASLPAVVEEVGVQGLLGEAEVVGAPKRGCLATERRDQAVEAEVGVAEVQTQVQKAVTPVDLKGTKSGEGIGQDVQLLS